MEPFIQVITQQGILKGCTGKNLDDETFYQFFGIPYGQPPLGNLRFKDPVPAEKWVDVRDATKEPPISYSIDEFSAKPEGSEDCLYLNVYTKCIPISSENNLKPVMVWIHGGAFLQGTCSPSLYGPEFLMTQDIVLVVIQYRLGICGFLRLKDPSLGVFGNAGLKDQCLAFKWVKENIKHFGGDPGNVTIFGESAGGTSVNLHMLSPLSKGLFNKAILESGSAIKVYDECVHDAINLAELIDKDIRTEKEALDLFSSLPIEKLFAAQVQYIMKNEVGTINKQFGPVIEHPKSPNPFLAKRPIDIVKSGEYHQVPILTGYNSKEGMLYDYYKKYNPSRIMTIDSAIPHFLYLEKGSEQRKKLQNQIEQFYFKNGEYDDNLRNLLGDVSYVIGTMAMATNHSRTSNYPVYLYRCALDTSINYLKNKIGFSYLPGTCHMDEVSYLFNNAKTREKLKKGSEEEKFIRIMVKLWTNFAKHGNPTPNEKDFGILWKPFKEIERNFLNIGKELYADVNPDKERIDFWAQILRQHDITRDFL